MFTHQLVLDHVNGDVRKVEVICARPPLLLDIRWDLSGLFTIDLKQNKIRGIKTWRIHSMVDARLLYYKMRAEFALPLQSKSKVNKAGKKELSEIALLKRSGLL